MKRKVLLISVIIMIFSAFITMSACTLSAEGSIKAITKPYMAEYECIEARLGNNNLLEKYDYIIISLLDKDTMEVSFKPKNSDKKTFKGNYKVNTETREFTGEVGILGASFKETVKIEKGEFIITKNILSMPIIMKFKMK